MSGRIVHRWSTAPLGHGVEYHFRLLGVHLTLGRAVGLYGFPHTVSYSARVWRTRG